MTRRAALGAGLALWAWAATAQELSAERIAALEAEVKAAEFIA